MENEKIEEYNVLHFCDNPALNAEAVRVLLYWRMPKRFTEMRYAFFETDSYGKLYFKTTDKDDNGERTDYAAYQFDTSGNRRYYTDDYSAPDGSVLNSKEELQPYYDLSHFSPKSGRGKVYTRWQDEQNWPLSKEVSDRRQVTFGTFPQTQVTDTMLIRRLNALPLSWTTVCLIKGEGVRKGKDVKVRIADVTLDGERYRAAQLAYDEEEYNYRVSDEYYPFSRGEIYWFRFEPLTWTVIDKEKGLLLCDKIVDYEPFYTEYDESWDGGCTRKYTDSTKQHFRSQYAFSYVRQWLNDAFLSVAFGKADREKLRTTSVSNEPYSPLYPEYGTADVEDRVFLPSVSEMTNAAYGFSTSALTQDAGRAAVCTDYARLLSFGGYDVDCVLRTAGNPATEFTVADAEGCVHLGYNHAGYGIRPAACADLTLL